MKKRLEEWFVANEKKFVERGMENGAVRVLESGNEAESGMEILMKASERSGRIFLSNTGSLETEINDTEKDVTVSYEYFELSEGDSPEQFLDDYVFLMGLAGGCSCTGCGN